MIQRFIAWFLPYLPKKFVWLFSRKYIAGEKLENALNTIIELQQQHISSTIDILGESIDESSQALEYQKQYLKTVEHIGKAKLPSTFSVKPTMFGLLWDEEFCYTCIREIILAARRYNYFVRIDMEDSQCTDKEISLYQRLYREFPMDVGIVFQACLKRTLSDLQHLLSFSTAEYPPNIRLCKGIYREAPDIAFQKKQEVRDNFMVCLQFMVENNMYPAIASHDDYLIHSSIELLKKFDKTSQNFEFQMLLGVTPGQRKQLVSQGYNMRVYVPYGKEWFRYSTRRLQENPNMVRDIIAGIFSRK